MRGLVSATELRVRLGESLDFLGFRCSASKMSTASSGRVRTHEATFPQGLLHNRFFMLEAVGIIRATVGASGSLSWEERPWGFVLWATAGVLSVEFLDHGLCARHQAGAEFSRDYGPTWGCP